MEYYEQKAFDMGKAAAMAGKGPDMHSDLTKRFRIEIHLPPDHSDWNTMILHYSKGYKFGVHIRKNANIFAKLYWRFAYFLSPKNLY